MLNPNNKAARIKRPFPYIEEQLILELRNQIEFYFSMVNLATDKFLKRLIEADRRGWVHIRELAPFPRIKSLIMRAFQKQPSDNEIEHLVTMALEHSDRVQTDKGRIKLRKRMVWQRDCRRVLYFEGQGLEVKQVVEFLSLHHVPRETYSIKCGNNWHFVDLEKLTETQIGQLYEKIKPYCSEHMVTVMNIDQFRQFEKRYQQLFTTQKEENTKTLINVPPRQLVNCMEIEVKTRPKGPKKKSVHKEVNYAKIFSKYVKSRNKKTPQSYEKHRADKIAEWRQKKQQKHRHKSGEQAMQIEQ